MSKNIEKTFYTEYADEFEEYINRFIYEMKERNPGYLKVSSEMELLKKDYPKVREVLEDNMQQPLDEEEIQTLIKINILRGELEAIINREMFFKGGNEAINHLKALGML